MPARYRTNNIPQISQRGIFFDANILIYLFWPTKAQWERKYSSIYGVLVRSNAQMYVDFIVLSEVINRAIRFEYKNYLKAHNLNSDSFIFKQYRNSLDGQQSISDVYDIVKTDILGHFNIAGKYFQEVDITQLLSDTEIDLNDKAIELICQENNFILLTNDGDFRNSSLDILSENTNLT